MSTRGTEAQRLHALTGLRFFAAFGVVLYHVGLRGTPELLRVAGLGNTGVTFFFVLSGFVLAWTAREGDTAGRFYWRRFARVWPLHFVTALLAVALIWSWGEPGSLGVLALGLLLLQAWMPWRDWHYSFNQVSWSLSCEAFFYATFPLLAPRLLRHPRRAARVAVVVPLLMAAFCAAVLVVIPSQGGFLLYVNPAYRLGEFLVGISLATLIRSGWRPFVGLRGAAALTLGAYVAAMVLAFTVYGGPLFMPAGLSDLMLLPGYALLIAATAAHELDGRATWLSRRQLVILGEWSFALYLIHDLVVRQVEEHSHIDAPGWLLAVGIVVLSVVLSGVLHGLVECPVYSRARGMIGGRDRHVQERPTSTVA